jgi:hypothetical protein
MTIDELREGYHKAICDELLWINENSKKGNYPSNQLCKKPKSGAISGQQAGKTFERITRDFLERSFNLLQHIRPGKWGYYVETDISHFEQYKDLADIESAIAIHKNLATLFGKDYIIRPDIIISRAPLADDEINSKDNMLLPSKKTAQLTPLRRSNYSDPKPILHASISCKWTLRSDRAQNIRTEAQNLIRNRKGKIPHIMAVTAEPTLTRIASLALGSGDIDCVYHFALNELQQAVLTIDDESQTEMFNILVDGRRLRDISDLPFDLAI